jgi:GNAT superfamily N-acetyltransferase
MAGGALPPFRDRVRNALDRMRRLVRARGVVPGLALAVGPALLWRLRVHLLAVYRHPGGNSGVPDDPSVELVTGWEGFTEADRAVFREYGGDALVARLRLRLSRGDGAAVLRSDGALACCCWVHEVSSYPPGARERALLLQSAFTVPGFRGRGLFPRTLSFAVRCLERDRPGVPIYIEASIDNLPSRRGIEKAGFARVALRVTSPLGQRWFPAWARPVP